MTKHDDPSAAFKAPLGLYFTFGTVRLQTAVVLKENNLRAGIIMRIPPSLPQMPFHQISFPGIPSEVMPYVGIALLLVGFVLGLFGRRVWGKLMSLLGAIIGGTFAYSFGVVLWGYWGGLIFSIVGAIIGSYVFGFMVKVGLAALAGILAFMFVTPLSGSIVVGILALIIVFAIAFYFIESLIGIACALLGGMLVALGTLFTTGDVGLSFAAGAGIFVIGAILQTFAFKKPLRRPIPLANVTPPQFYPTVQSYQQPPQSYPGTESYQVPQSYPPPPPPPP